MKTFVIKNKEGKYCTGEFNKNDEYIFTENLIYAEKYYKDTFAQSFCPKDCEVVEITIAEGDLEQQLAEKDKCIEFLKMSVSFEQEHKNKALDELKQIRYEICDEIRNYIDNNDHEEVNEAKQSSDGSIYTRLLYNFLDKIEQGEGEN